MQGLFFLLECKDSVFKAKESIVPPDWQYDNKVKTLNFKNV